MATVEYEEQWGNGGHTRRTKVVVGQPSPQITCYPQPVTCPPQYTSCPPQPVRYYPKSATGPRCHVAYQPCPPQPLTRPPRAVQHPRPAQATTRPIVTQPVHTTRHRVTFSRTPVLCKCCYCGVKQMTRVSLRYGDSFWMMFVLLFLFLGPFAFILFLFDDLKDAYHTCPNCNNVVGSSRT